MDVGILLQLLWIDITALAICAVIFTVRYKGK